jgi:hypothetical protein
MNRKIMFRGKRISDGKWIYGYLSSVSSITTTIEDDHKPGTYLIDKETVGQFIGLYDKNKKPVFEFDLVKTREGIGKIVFWCGSFWIDNGLREDNSLVLISDRNVEIEVIGNIYETPELLNK